MSGRILGITEMIDRTPFRQPYLLIDRAIIDDAAESIQAVKAVTGGEAFFCGHFPSKAIMPGVLQVESMVQAGCLLAGNVGPNPFVREAENIKFRKPVVPGDILEISAQILERGESQVRIQAKTEVAGQVTSQGTFRIDLDSDPADFVPLSMIPESKFPFPEDGPALDFEQIQGRIPHRFPFLLIDRVVRISSEDDGVGEIIGIKNVNINEPLFQSRSSEHPYLPNYVQMEIVAQLGCIYTLSLPQNQNKLGLYMGVDKATFYRPVLPGDRLLVHARQESRRARFGKCSSNIYVGQDVVADISFKFAITDVTI